MAHMATAEHEPITGSGAMLPERSRGRASGQRVRRRSPLKLNTFLCCDMPEMARSCYVYELFYVINDNDCQRVYMRNAAAEF